MKTKRSISRSRVEQMVVLLRNDILTGKYAVGTYIPSELELCKLFQLSKITVRKGLEVLVSEGYIEKIPRIGAKVMMPKHTEGITLKFGYHTSLIKETQILNLVHSFNQLHPNIHIQPIPVQFPSDHNLMEDYLQESMYDVMTVNIYDYEVMASTPSGGFLEPLDANDGIYPQLNKPFTTNNKLYAQPFVFTPVVLCYNKDHFKELGISEPDGSWTWEDVREASEKLMIPKERYGLFFHLLSDNRWPLFLIQNEVFVNRNQEGKYDLRSDERLKEGLHTCMEFVQEKSIFPSYFSENERDVESLFVREKVSMIIATYSSLNAFIDAPLNYDISPLPYMHDAKTLLVEIGISINAQSPHKQAAQLFADYLLSYEAQLYIRKNTLSIPAMKSVAEWTGEELIPRPSRFHLYREIMNTFRLYTDLNLSYTELATMRNELKLYWSELDNLDTVLGRIEEKLEAL